MGISDRDYMRERERDRFARQRPFEPPRSSTSWVWIFLFWGILAAVLFKVFSAYSPLKPPRAMVALTETRSVPRPTVQTSRSPAPDVEVLQQRATAIERRVEQRTVVSTERTDPPSNTIHLCRAYSGGTFWARAHCNQHNALIERIAYVPPNLPFEQQVALAVEQRSQAQKLAESPGPTRVVEAAPVNQQARCRELDARVVQLDALARQPQSAQMQDWIAAQRKEARDMQFRLRC